MPNVVATQPSIAGAVCESSVIPFLVRRRKVWLMPTGQMPCSNAANIGERKTWTQSDVCTWLTSLCGQKPTENVYIGYSPGDGQTSCKVWFTSCERRNRSHEAKMRNPLKFAAVQQKKPLNRSQPSMGWYVPYCGDIWRRYCCLTSFFPIFITCLSCEDIARQSCAMVPRWRYFASCIFSELRAAHFRPAS